MFGGQLVTGFPHEVAKFAVDGLDIADARSG
jgi:hypothetical protein